MVAIQISKNSIFFSICTITRDIMKHFKNITLLYFVYVPKYRSELISTDVLFKKFTRIDFLKYI